MESTTKREKREREKPGTERIVKGESEFEGVARVFGGFSRRARRAETMCAARLRS